MARTTPPARIATRNRRLLIIALIVPVIVVIAVIATALAFRAPRVSSVSSSAPSLPPASFSPELPIVTPTGDHRLTAGKSVKGEADGALPDGVTVFDQGYPGVAKLNPELLQALRKAATDAAHDSVKLYVDSGWRSREYQDQLLREAVSKYGSKKEAARWVATADTSPHVSGDAVDVGHSNATAWLSAHGAEYGLCQIYRNEAWHYELRTNAIDHGCPRLYADPTQDPRMQQ